MAELALNGVGVEVGARTLLREIDFAPPSGALTAIIGPNGSGKSTLLRVASGYLSPTRGVVTLSGIHLEALPPVARAAKLHWLPQTPPSPWAMDVETLVSLSLERAEDRASIDAAIETMGLGPLRHARGDRLSGGERQRLHLARAMWRAAPVLLADEPVEALDPAWQLVAMDWLARHARGGNTVVAVLHDLSLVARYATHIVALKDGAILSAGPTREVLTPALIGDLYGVRATVDLDRAPPTVTVTAALPAS